jgi:hypothetical protein
VRAVVRHAGNRDENFLKITDDPAYFKPVMEDIAAAANLINTLSHQRGADFICVIHPFPFSFEPQYTQWKQILLVKGELERASIPYVDLYPAFETALEGKNHLDYGWAMNKHFNARGYELYAWLLYAEVESKYPGYWMGQ